MLICAGSLQAYSHMDDYVTEGEEQSVTLRSTDSDEAVKARVYQHFSKEVVDRGKEYRNTKYVMFFMRIGISIVFLSIIVWIRGARWIGYLSDSPSSDKSWLIAGIVAAILTVAISAVTLPVNIYSGYIHEHAFGLSTRDLSGWLFDLGKYVTIQVVLAFIIFAGLYRIMAAFPSAWWIVSAAVFSLFTVAMTALSPLIIDPLFNKFTPLEDEDLKKDVIELAKDAGIEVDKVYKMNASLRTRKLNAYFTGLGKTKRVILYDTLLSKSSPSEVKMVLAHEIGHWKRNHLWKGLLLASSGTFIVVFIISRVLASPFALNRGIASFDDPAGVPLIMLIVLLLGFLSMPIQNAISRHFENQADMDSLILTEDPDTFIRVEEKMGRTNLNDVDPNPLIKWLLFTHPSTMERILVAEKFKRQRPFENAEERI